MLIELLFKLVLVLVIVALTGLLAVRSRSVVGRVITVLIGVCLLLVVIWDRCPISTAAEYGDIRKAQKLLAANPSLITQKCELVKNTGRQPPLYWAAAEGQKDMVEFLLSKGANIDERGSNGRTPLFGAVEGKQKEVVRYLLTRGAQVDAKDDGGNTPLLDLGYANRDITELLLTAGADPNVRNQHGQTVLTLTMKYGSKETAEILREYGARE